jgi:hypothetical protein
MVLKIVRGKILETLELASFPAARGSVLAPRGRCGGRIQRVSGPGGASAVSLSKIDDYLADKFCALMLSEVMDGFKNKENELLSRFQIGNRAPTPRRARRRISLPHC